MFRRFKKGSKDAAAAALKERERVPAPGDELTRELEDAWYMYTRVSKHEKLYDRALVNFQYLVSIIYLQL